MLRSLTDQLTQVASLAEKFVSLRNGLSRSVWSKHVDSLDEQGLLSHPVNMEATLIMGPGVNLWNISGITRGLSHPDERAYTAACESNPSFQAVTAYS